MGNPWFRMYHEFATDPKVQKLSESDQRRYVMVLCLKCCNGDETLHDEDVAFQLRISNDQWAETKAVLVAKRLIDNHNNPVAWNKRQYQSDSSTARVRKFREGKKQECNVSVTPSDTDTDTENKEAGSGEPSLPEGKKAKGAILLTTYLENRKAEGKTPFDDTDPIYKYADEIKLPDEFLALCWGEFVERYRESEKRQKNWPQTFRNCVRGNWYKLWWLNGDNYELTTTGQQARKKREAA